MRRHLKPIRLLVISCLFAGIALGQSSQQQPASSQTTPVLAVTGDVATPLQLTREDLASMPRQTVTVHEENGSSAQYEGVLLRDTLSGNSETPWDGLPLPASEDRLPSDQRERHIN